jgi:hypothetical protein
MRKALAVLTLTLVVGCGGGGGDGSKTGSSNGPLVPDALDHDAAAAFAGMWWGPASMNVAGYPSSEPSLQQDVRVNGRNALLFADFCSDGGGPVARVTSDSTFTFATHTCREVIDGCAITLQITGGTGSLSGGQLQFSLQGTASTCDAADMPLTVSYRGTHTPGWTDRGPPSVIVNPSYPTTAPGVPVSLDASGSSDPDGLPLTFSWTVASQPTGAPPQLTGAATARPTFTATAAGQYGLELVVTASDGQRTTIWVYVNVVRYDSGWPTAMLTPSTTTAAPGEAVALDASGSSDPDGLALTFSWTVTQQPSNGAASLTGTSSPQATFTASVQGTYTVLVTVISEDGYTATQVATIHVTNVREIGLATNDLVYDPWRQVLYASVPSRGGVNGNRVAVINPWTRTVSFTGIVGSEPNKLAISDDGRFLYVGLDGAPSVARLDLAGSSGPIVDKTLQLGSDASGSLYAADIEVMPGSAGTAAISLRYSWGSHVGVVIVDDDVARLTRTASWPAANPHIEFGATAGTLYGLDDWGEFHDLAVSNTGVSVATTALLGGSSSSDFASGAGLVFTGNGVVFDPEARVVRGTFPGLGSWGTSVEASPTGAHVLYLAADGSAYPEQWFVKAYAHASYLPTGSEPLPGIANTPKSLVRCGTRGVAFRGGDNYGTPVDKVYVLDTPLAAP